MSDIVIVTLYLESMQYAHLTDLTNIRNIFIVKGKFVDFIIN